MLTASGKEAIGRGEHPLARIVLVHDDTDFLRKAAAAIRAAGYEVATFDRSMAAPISIPELVDRASRMLAE